MTEEYVLVEYGRSAGDRWPVKEVGILLLEPGEAAEMNRRMVRTPCRVLPALHFKKALQEVKP